jgi:hypothetical protein
MIYDLLNKSAKSKNIHVLKLPAMVMSATSILQLFGLLED